MTPSNQDIDVIDKTQVIEAEIDEMLFMAFVGHFVRDPDGNFVSLDDKYGVLKDALKKDIQSLISDITTEAVIKELEFLLDGAGRKTGVWHYELNDAYEMEASYMGEYLKISEVKDRLKSLKAQPLSKRSDV